MNDEDSITAVTKDTIKDGLARLGIRPSYVLAVHRSLGRLGHVRGGADAVIEALIETVGEDGAIVMPAYTVSSPVPLTPEDIAHGLAWKVRLLPAGIRQVQTAMGAIADHFRDRPDVVLGGQRVHRIAAWGRQAADLVRGHDALLARDGVVLLLGVDMDRCSVPHLGETRVALPEAVVAQTKVPEAAHAYAQEQYPAAEWAVGFRVPIVNYCIVREVAEELGLIRTTTIGSARALSFAAGQLVDLYERLRREDPFRLLDYRYRESTD